MDNHDFNRSFILLIVIVGLFSCSPTNYLSSIEASKETLNKDMGMEADAAIKALIQPYKVKLDEQMNQVIGETVTDLKKKRPESTLGNWMADALQRQTEKQIGKPIAFAIQNYGGIRIPQIKKGKITRGMIYELMPFDNTIVILSLNSVEIQELIQHITSGGGWPVSQGIKVTEKEGRLDIKINGVALKRGTTYQVALPDYVANGGSDSDFLVGKQQQALPLYIRDILIADVEEHTANQQVIESKIEGRMVLTKK
ncbi:MAG: 5'-nucleotidase C-terminal domain-containing protein [Saprospiraceae bacterium]